MGTAGEVPAGPFWPSWTGSSCGLVGWESEPSWAAVQRQASRGCGLAQSESSTWLEGVAWSSARLLEGCLCRIIGSKQGRVRREQASGTPGYACFHDCCYRVLGDVTLLCRVTGSLTEPTEGVIPASTWSLEGQIVSLKGVLLALVGLL